MFNVFDFIKSAVVVVTTAISVLNPFNATIQKPLNNLSVTPSPIQEKTISVTPENPSVKQESAYQSDGNKETKTIPTKAPAPTNDPDPLITCNSKTGKITVRLSVCKSHTDCPNGNGGYVFESQEACKNRWKQLANQLKNTTDEYVKALKEQNDLNAQKLKLDQDQYNKELQQKLQQQTDDTNKFISDLEAKARAENQRILEEQQEYFKNFIKTPTPTPTPYFQCPGGGCQNFSY